MPLTGEIWNGRNVIPLFPVGRDLRGVSGRNWTAGHVSCFFAFGKDFGGYGAAECFPLFCLWMGTLSSSPIGWSCGECFRLCWGICHGSRSNSVAGMFPPFSLRSVLAPFPRRSPFSNVPRRVPAVASDSKQGRLFRGFFRFAARPALWSR